MTTNPRRLPANVKCLIPGCSQDTRLRSGKLGQLCEPHWFRLPLELRKRFWLETDFNKRSVPAELKAAIVAALREPPKAERGA